MFDKILQVNLLYDFYGQLLTEKQQSVLQLYYIDDLSLGEISEQYGVSRQAIYDSIKRAEKCLFDYEEKLGLVLRFTETQKKIEEVIRILENIEGNTNELIENPELILCSISEIKSIAINILEN